MTKTYVVISDVQAPFEDRKALKAVLNFVGDYQPDEVVQIGDLADFPQPSRWNKDSAGEFEGSIYRDAEHVTAKFSEPLRAVFDGPVTIFEGNHDERPRVYLSKFAPALVGTDAVNFENLLHFDDFGFTKAPEFWEFAPDWIMTHGHRGGIRLTQSAGMTAFGAAKNKFLKSVIMGHTHRLGAVSGTYGVGNTTRMLTGVEVGHLMNPKLAGYLKGAVPNWQQGFAVVKVDGKRVSATPVPIIGGQFEVDGESYRV